MTRARRFVLPTIICLSWAAVIADTLPMTGALVTPEVSRLAVLAACVGTLIYAMRRVARPATEVYLMGVQEGRREALADAGTLPEGKIVRMSDWR